MVIYRDGAFYFLPIAEASDNRDNLDKVDVSVLTEIDIHDLNNLLESFPNKELIDVRQLKEINVRDSALVIKQDAGFISLPYPKGLSLDNIDVVGYIGETKRKIVVFGTKNAGCFLIPPDRPLYDPNLKLSNKIEETAAASK